MIESIIDLELVMDCLIACLRDPSVITLTAMCGSLNSGVSAQLSMSALNNVNTLMCLGLFIVLVYIKRPQGLISNDLGLNFF